MTTEAESFHCKALLEKLEALKQAIENAKTDHSAWCDVQLAAHDISLKAYLLFWTAEGDSTGYYA